MNNQLNVFIDLIFGFFLKEGKEKKMKKTFTGNDFTAVFTDENGYFSLTGDFNGSSGAIGKSLSKKYPAFKPLNAVHLAKCGNGEPFHAIANGLYHAKAVIKGEKPLQELVEYMNAPQELVERFLAVSPQIAIYKEAEKEIENIKTKTKLKNLSSYKEEFDQITAELSVHWESVSETIYEIVERMPSDMTATDETISLEDYGNPEKVKALAEFTDLHYSLIKEEGDRFVVAGKEYLVLTDKEADKTARDLCISYAEECILFDMSKNHRKYFDMDKFVSDCLIDGRGHVIASYDGREDKTADYFIYRV